MRYATAYKVSEKRKRIMTYIKQVSERNNPRRRKTKLCDGRSGCCVLLTPRLRNTRKVLYSVNTTVSRMVGVTQA